MGNKIGDYIHYSAGNYLREGTSEIGTFKAWKSQRESLIRENRNKLDPGLAQQDYQKISEALEAIMHNGNVPDSKEEKARENIMKYLVDKFQDTLQDVDVETGKVKLKNDNANVMGIARASSTNITAMLRKANQLEEILTRQIESGEEGTTDAKMALITVLNLEKEWNSIADAVFGTMRDSKVMNVDTTQNPLLKKTLEEKKSALNQLISEFAAYPAIQLQQGDFFEAAVAQLPDLIDEVIDAEIKGDIRELVSFDSDSFISEMNGEEISKTFGDILERTSYSQGKIDVTFNWKGQDDIIKELNASVKNANFAKHYIHILSGSSLLFMIQDIDTDFVNHFLNLFAKHKDKSKVNGNTFTSLRAQMLEEMRLVLFYKALTGANYQRTNANLFIANDNQTGKVKVYGAHQLVQKAVDNISDLRGIQINNKTFNEKNTSFKNDWSGASAAARISGLLADVHAAKVSASINVDKML